MAQISSSSQRLPTAAAGVLPTVRLEVRAGAPRAQTHEVADAGYLIGSVPGCDLRLPGLDLPPVICLLVRHAGGARLRKLAATQPVLVNGTPATPTPLADGDRITIGNVELAVQIQFPAEAPDGVHSPTALAQPSQPIEHERRKLQEGLQKKAQAAALEELATARADLEKREEQLQRQQQDLASVRQELTDIRQQLYERYRQRRDRLAGMHQAIDRAAHKIQERKRLLDAEAEQAAAEKAHFEQESAQLAKTRQVLEDQRRLLDSAQEESQRDCAKLQAREEKLIKDRETLDQGQSQYQADLVRLDRLQATLDQRQQQLDEQARATDARYDQMQQTSRDLEEQAQQLAEWNEKVRGEAERSAQQKAEHDAAAAQLGQRAAALEGQQAMLAALRTRLERMREEVRREQQQTAEQQSRLDAAEADLKRRLEEAEQLRAEVSADRQLQERERQEFAERQKVLDDAVSQLRQVEAALTTRETDLRRRSDDLDAVAARQTAESARLQTQSEQLLDTQKRLTADREALREREAALLQTEQARAALQEQLHRRSEELTARQRTLAEQARQQAEEITALETRRANLDHERRQAEDRHSTLRQEIEGRAAAVERQHGELVQREERWQRHVERLKETGRKIGRTRKSLRAERVQWEAAQAEAAEAAARTRAEFEAAQREAAALHQQFPELELRAQGAGERLVQAREQLREHLDELHTYARQSQEDIEALRAQVQLEAEQARQQQISLHRAREEHRLAVAAFRQQLIAWQGQIVEMKRSLAHGETRLERRQAQVIEQARQLDASSLRLAQQAEHLQEQERVVAEERQEMGRHLDDMREWYRRKLRELSERRRQEEGERADVSNAAAPAARSPVERDIDSESLNPAEGPSNILAITSEIDPGDRKLGDLLRTLNLVDEETLTALLVEARRQRRSLRQALLAGGYLTLYQMALIETGNIDGLVFGPLRVIDRLRVTSHEAVYRVFDPRRGQEAVLRHLVDTENPLHAAEFRRQFASAVPIRHPHLAAALEVLEISDRPAVLQEWLVGLPSTDWPSLAAVPGVWFRLVCQAALGLHTAHQAGLVHGHLHPDLFLLTGEGMVKLCGLGEPLWLLAPPLPLPGQSAASGDLYDFGRIAANWAALAARRKAPRLLAEPLQAILNRLTAEDTALRYPNAEAVLEELDKAGANVPANAEAWDRLLRHVRDHAAEEARLRQSA